VQQRGGRLRLGRLSGPAEVWLDGMKLAQAQAGEVALDLLLPAKAQARDLAVLLTVRAGEEFGFRDVVTVSVE
jgi:beta-galactosidase